MPQVEDSAIKAALKLIMEFEGCELRAYPDPGTGGDPITIGWGATGPDIRLGLVWTQRQADTRLSADVSKFASGVRALVTRPTTAGQLGAMISLAYNIGLAAFKKSTLLRLFNAGDVAGARKQFAAWNKSGGRVMAGLTRRRAAEAAVFGATG